MHRDRFSGIRRPCRWNENHPSIAVILQIGLEEQVAQVLGEQTLAIKRLFPKVEITHGRIHCASSKRNGHVVIAYVLQAQRGVFVTGGTMRENGFRVCYSRNRAFLVVGKCALEATARRLHRKPVRAQRQPENTRSCCTRTWFPAQSPNLRYRIFLRTPARCDEPCWR